MVIHKVTVAPASGLELTVHTDTASVSTPAYGLECRSSNVGIAGDWGGWSSLPKGRAGVVMPVPWADSRPVCGLNQQTGIYRYTDAHVVQHMCYYTASVLNPKCRTCQLFRACFTRPKKGFGMYCSLGHKPQYSSSSELSTKSGQTSASTSSAELWKLFSTLFSRGDNL